MPNDDGTLLIENAQLRFRNFEGREGMYNREGDRNFCVLLEPATAERMAQDGWNIKTLKPREEGEEGTPYIQVSVGFKGRPPTLVVLSSKGRTDLGQHECEILDWFEIKKVDLIIRPYEWSVNGKHGIKAYLKSLFMTIEEDYLQQKYSDVPYARELAPAPAQLQIGPGEDPNIIDAEIVED